MTAKVSLDLVYNRVEEMMSQLEKSYPQTLQKIIDMNPFPDSDEFFIYTFTKWDYSGDKPKYMVFHQPRRSCPDAFWGTVLRKLNKKNSTIETVWCLPHEHTLANYSNKDNEFFDPFVAKCIEKMIAGEYDRYMREYNTPEEFKKV